mgnify:CR=1 FL=1
MIGLVGRKVGMTRIFNEDGVSVPVTVIEIEANRVTQVKTILQFKLLLVLKKRIV